MEMEAAERLGAPMQRKQMQAEQLLLARSGSNFRRCVFVYRRVLRGFAASATDAQYSARFPSVKRIAAQIALVAGAIAIAGCGGDSGSVTDLSGKDFVGVSVAAADGAKPPSIDDLEGLQVDFSEEGDRVSWSADCNPRGSDAKTTESQIQIVPGAATAMECPGGPAESWFEQFMLEEPEWRLDGSTLTLSTDHAVVELEATERSE